MLRTSWRYLLLRVPSEQNFSENDLKYALSETIEEFFGVIGLSQISLKIIRYEPSKGRAIVRCRAQSTEMLRSSITLLTQISGKTGSISTICVSGTIKSLTLK
ncbi:MAG: Rpp14/Pop5 family protein [Candidatus Bathyarchaeia archaeon]|jgi:RNase P/RNase MRP subunit POP5|nr:Rpp14/Pop5 family protein [Candidatus Bathyarchaeota archaeon]